MTTNKFKVGDTVYATEKAWWLDPDEEEEWQKVGYGPFIIDDMSEKLDKYRFKGYDGRVVYCDSDILSSTPITKESPSWEEVAKELGCEIEEDKISYGPYREIYYNSSSSEWLGVIAGSPPNQYPAIVRMCDVDKFCAALQYMKEKYEEDHGTT